MTTMTKDEAKAEAMRLSAKLKAKNDFGDLHKRHLGAKLDAAKKILADAGEPFEDGPAPKK